MPRTLNVSVETELQKSISTVYHLVEITFDGAILQFCSFGDTEWVGGAGGSTWIGKGMEVKIAKDAPGGVQSVRLELENDDTLISGYGLGSGVRNRPLRIWEGHLASPGPTDPVLRFVGVLTSAVSYTKELAVFRGRSSEAYTSHSPRFVLSRARLPLLMKDGYKMTWQGEKITFYNKRFSR